jgi:2-methylisocitrate lyase-like PEP mutase family enzyme
MKMETNPGNRLRQELKEEAILPFIGVYDVFSASIAAKYYNCIFISGFGFAASYYGLPDIGFIAWSEIVAFVQRVRTVLPNHHIIVDIDDGYADAEIACHVVSLLEASGASGIIIEDQQRPRKCGHFRGKQIMELDEYMKKLKKVLETRKEMFVVARTDATDNDERARRAVAFAKAGADAVLMDALTDLSLITRLRSEINKPFAFNQIAGGKSPRCNMSQLKDIGVSIVIYSTPCLFPVQGAVENAMKFLKENDGILPLSGNGIADVQKCTAQLNENLAKRDDHG